MSNRAKLTKVIQNKEKEIIDIDKPNKLKVKTNNHDNNAAAKNKLRFK